MAIVCEFCGKEYEESPGKFCDQCGRVLARASFTPEVEEEKNKCMKCGHLNSMDSTICVNCGDRLYQRQYL